MVSAVGAAAIAQIAAGTSLVPTEVEKAEAVISGDDRIVRVYLKIRDTIAEVNDEYKERLAVLKAQQDRLKAELLRRLHERGATQTKTEAGTAFITENTTFTIADEELYGKFVLEQQDVDFYQRRAKAEHVKEYMKNNGGMLPPGLTIFTEQEINVRIPRKKGVPSGAADAGAADPGDGG